MAVAVCMTRSLLANKSGYLSSVLTRGISTSQPVQDDRWFSKLLVRRIEPSKESHSRMLSDKDTVYELQTHFVKPDGMDKYVKNYETYVKTVQERKDVGAKLVGSWTVDVGDQDQAVHLWAYPGGYKNLYNSVTLHKTDPELKKMLKDREPLLRKRFSQYLLAFSFWNAPTPRSGSNLYEFRSYILKPGTMIEWGNNWARAIHFRQHDSEAFCGFFSQCGVLYNVHHIWVYQDLQKRKETREHAWQKPGWDECVAHTVPLIRSMESRIMYPTSYSPTQ